MGWRGPLNKTCSTYVVHRLCHLFCSASKFGVVLGEMKWCPFIMQYGEVS